MGRKRNLTNTRAKCANDLQSLPSMHILRATWLTTLNRTAHSPDSKLHHPCFDPRTGLGVLARATIIRAIMKTEIKRDYRADVELPADAAWQIAFTKQAHTQELFSKGALGADSTHWLRKDSASIGTLYDLNWRNKVCNGFKKEKYYVNGLNAWFCSRYQKNLPGGVMTDHLLFETRFFGESAIDNYVCFLLQGKYVPGTNITLAHHPEFSASELEADASRAGIVETIIDCLKGPDNKGKPIVAVSCKGNPTAASRLAISLVTRLGKNMQSACYVPLSKFTSKKQLNDHGFRSIVEVIHRFITGEATLECSPSEWSEPDLAAKLRQVRGHLVRVPTVFVFDGFKPGTTPYPALVNFIRDEPLERILRLLQHPDPGEWSAASGDNIANFRQSYFVVIGEPSSTWLSMHRNLTAELKFSELDQINALSSVHLRQLNTLIMETHAEYPLAHATNEWTLNALSFLQRKNVLTVENFKEVENYQQLLGNAFRRYWSELKPWQRTYFRSLALSESGLRWSTAAQVFESYSRFGRHGANNTESFAEPVGAETFRKFIDDACDGNASSPWLFEYSDGLESDAYDIFDYPTEAISKMSDTHSWIAAHRTRKPSKQYTVNFRDMEVRKLILQMTTANEALVIRRILSELSLQTYRIRIRHSSPVRRIGRRAARSLAEALLHGFHSLDSSPSAVKTRAALPEYTLGEIPALSASAFSFLYSVVYKDLFCGGDITNIGQQHGNGDLELEMLLMIGAGQQLDADPCALDDPMRSVQVPVWFSHGRGRLDDIARSNSLNYLFAICRCAKRASRVNIFRVSLEKVSAMHEEMPLKPADLLTLRKLQCDLGMMTYGGTWHERKAGYQLWDEVFFAVVQCCFPKAPAGENHQRANELRRQLVEMKRNVREYVRRQISQISQISPTEIDNFVEDTRGRVLKILPARRLPREALTVLSRIAAVEGFSADRSLTKLATAVNPEHKRLMSESIMRHLVAIAFYWLSKAIVLRQRKDRPLTLAPRVGFRATERYIASVSSLKDLLDSYSKELSDSDRDLSDHPKHKDHNTQLIKRLCKSARGMLDTYTREQGVGKADHIAIQILECTFSRIVTPSSTQLCKFISKDSLTGDERLSGSLRCFRWLRAAELEMLSFSGQPTLRVMLCRERLYCVHDVLDRAVEHLGKKFPIPRKLSEGDGEGFHPFVEWMINDLRQLSNIIGFMKYYAPDALLIRSEWTRMLVDFLDSAQARRPLWKARDDGAYNNALKLLDQVIVDLKREFGRATVTAQPSPTVSSMSEI